jgi:hypothetical protein
MNLRAAGPLVLLIGTAAYVAALAFGYYLHAWNVARHHVETGWMWFVAVALIVALLTQPREPAQPDARARRRLPFAILTIVFVAAAFAAWWPALSVGFLSDDFVLLDRARHGQFIGGAVRFLRPLPLLLFKAIGDRPTVFHALNLGLHGVNAALVTAVAVELNVTAVAACVAGTLFVLFPAHAEAVVWCSGVQDVLMTTGVLGAILFAHRSQYALAGTSLAAGLLSKETAVAAPLLYGAIDRRRWRVVAGGFAMAALFAVGRFALVPVESSYAVAPSAYELKEMLARPLGTLAVPVHGDYLRDWPWLGVGLVWLLAGLVARAAWAWRGQRPTVLRACAFGVWVFFSVAPVYSMVDISSTLQGSRYVYLAAGGWSILTASLVFAMPRRLDLAIAACLLLVWMAGARMNARPWMQAAQMRDEVRSAAARARAAGCTMVWISAPPDSVRGAYVFRNGLAEALAPAALDPSAPKACWLDGQIGR